MNTEKLSRLTVKKSIKNDINLCFFMGTVRNDIDLKFVYNSKLKGLSRKHISIVIFELKLIDSQIINLYAYDEVADFIYKYIKKSDMVIVQGRFSNGYIHVDKIEKWM